MEGPGAPGPGAWAAWLPAGLPAPPPGWGGWEPRALAAAALATALVVLASRFVLASLLSKTLSKQGTRIKFRALSLFAVSGILVTSATGPVARLSIDGVRVHRRKLINMLWAKLYSPRSATVEIPVVVRGVRLSLRKQAAGPAGGAKPGKAAKKGPPLDANQIEEILGSLNGKWHGAVLLALARILRITVSDVVVDASPLCGATIGLGGIDVRVLRHRQELRVSLKVATSQADFIDADAGRTYDNSLLDTAVPLCLVDDLTVYSVVERGPERQRYVCSSVEATCKRAIFALSRRLLEQAGQAREAKGDGKGGGGAEGEGGEAGPARTLKRTLSSDKRVRQAMQALQGLVESFKLSVPVVEMFCAPDIPYLHSLDYSGSVREFTVFYKRSEDSLAAILQADEDPGSSLIYSMTVGRIHLGALGALHMQLSLQALAAEAHVPLPKTGLQFAEDFETETLPSVALELQGVATEFNGQLAAPLLDCLQGLAAQTFGRKGKGGAGLVPGAARPVEPGKMLRFQIVAADGLDCAAFDGARPLAQIRVGLGAVVGEVSKDARLHSMKAEMEGFEVRARARYGYNMARAGVGPEDPAPMLSLVSVPAAMVQVGKTFLLGDEATIYDVTAEASETHVVLSESVVETAAALGAFYETLRAAVLLKGAAKGPRTQAPRAFQVYNVQVAATDVEVEYLEDIPLARGRTAPLVQDVDRLKSKFCLGVRRVACNANLSQQLYQLDLEALSLNYEENHAADSAFAAVNSVATCSALSVSASGNERASRVQLESLDVHVDPDIALFAHHVAARVRLAPAALGGQPERAGEGGRDGKGRGGSPALAPPSVLVKACSVALAAADSSTRVQLEGRTVRYDAGTVSVAQVGVRLNGGQCVAVVDASFRVHRPLPAEAGSPEASRRGRRLERSPVVSPDQDPGPHAAGVAGPIPLLHNLGLLQAAHAARLLDDIDFLQTEAPASHLLEVDCASAQVLLPPGVAPGEVAATFSKKAKALAVALADISESLAAEWGGGGGEGHLGVRDGEGGGAGDRDRGAKTVQVVLNARELQFKIDHHPLDAWLLEHRKALQESMLDFRARERFLEVERKSTSRPTTGADALADLRGDDEEERLLRSQEFFDPRDAEQAYEDLSRQCSRKYIDYCQALARGKRTLGQETVRAGAQPSELAERVAAAMDQAPLFCASASDAQALFVLRASASARRRAVELAERVDAPHTAAEQVEEASARLVHLHARLGPCAGRLAGCPTPLGALDGLEAQGCLALLRERAAPPETGAETLQLGRWRRVAWRAAAKGATPPVKVYTDLEARAANLRGTFGPGMEPPLARMANECRRLSPGFASHPVATPRNVRALRLPWWDDFRYKFRGRPRVAVDGFTAVLATTTQEPDDSKGPFPQIRVTVPRMDVLLDLGALVLEWTDPAIDLFQPITASFHDAAEAEGRDSHSMVMTELPLARIAKVKVRFGYALSLPGGKDPHAHHLFHASLRSGATSQGPLPLGNSFRSSKLDFDLQIELGAGGGEGAAPATLVLGEAQIYYFAKYTRFMGLPARPLRWSWRARPYGAPPKKPGQRPAGIPQLMNSFTIDVKACPCKIKWYTISELDAAAGLYVHADLLHYKMNLSYYEVVFQTPRGTETKMRSLTTFLGFNAEELEVRIDEEEVPSTGQSSAADLSGLLLEAAGAGSAGTEGRDRENPFVGSVKQFYLLRGLGNVGKLRNVTIKEDRTMKIMVDGANVLANITAKNAVWSCVRGILTCLDDFGAQPYWEAPETRAIFRTSSGTPTLERMLSSRTSHGEDLLQLLLRQASRERDSPGADAASHKSSPRTPRVYIESPGGPGKSVKTLQVELRNVQVNLEGEASHGCFLLSAGRGLLLIKQQNQSNAGTVNERQRRHMTLSFERVQGHVTQNDVDPGAGVQWMQPVEKVHGYGDQMFTVELEPANGALTKSVFPPCGMQMHFVQQGVQQMYEHIVTKKQKVKWVPYHKEINVQFPEIQAAMEAREFEIFMDVLSNVAISAAPKITHTVQYRLLPISFKKFVQHYDRNDIGASLLTLRTLDCEVQRLVRELCILEGKDANALSIEDDLHRGVQGSHLTHLRKWWMVQASSAELMAQISAELEGALKGRQATVDRLKDLSDSILQDAGTMNLFKKSSADFKLSLEVTNLSWSLCKDRETMVMGIMNGLAFWQERYEDGLTVSQVTIRDVQFLDCMRQADLGKVPVDGRVEQGATQILGSWNVHKDLEREHVLRARAESAPSKAGMSVFTLCEVTVNPLAVDLTQQTAARLQEYVFSREGGKTARSAELGTPVKTSRSVINLTEGGATPGKKKRRASALGMDFSPLLKGSQSLHRKFRSWDGSQDRSGERDFSPDPRGHLTPDPRKGAGRAAKGRHSRHGSMDGFDALERKATAGSNFNLVEGTSTRDSLLSAAYDRVFQHNVEVAYTVSPNKPAASGKARSRSSRRNVRWERVRINTCSMMVTYAGYPINLTRMKILLDTREYHAMEGRWKDLIQRFTWDAVKSVLKSVTGLQNEKIKAMLGEDRGPAADPPGGAKAAGAAEKPPSGLRGLLKGLRGKDAGARKQGRGSIFARLSTSDRSVDRGVLDDAIEKKKARKKAEILFGQGYKSINN